MSNESPHKDRSMIEVCVRACLYKVFSDVDFPVWWVTCMKGWIYDDEQKMKAGGKRTQCDIKVEQQCRYYIKHIILCYI